MELAKYHGLLHENAIAIDLVAQGLKMRPDDPRLLMAAASTYETGLSDRQQALKYLQRAFALGLAVKDVQRAVAFKDLRKDPRYEGIEKTAVNK